MTQLSLLWVIEMATILESEVLYQSGVLEYPLPKRFLRERGGEIFASRE